MLTKDEVSEPAPPSEMAKEIATMVSNSEDAAARDLINSDPRLESDIDVPNTFWDSTSVADEPRSPSEVKLDLDVPAERQTIKFKANGEEIELSYEDAAKRLAMAEGGARAFTQLAQANKRVKELESSSADMRHKADLMDKLESLRHDPKKLLEIVTGQDADTYLADQVRKYNIRESGDAREIAQLEKEERFAQLERQLQMQEERQQELETKEEARFMSSEKTRLKGLMDGEFFKHQFKMENPLDSNDMNEMLYQDSHKLMAKYVRKYQDHPKFQELLPKIAQKSFEDTASKLTRLTTGSVQNKVDQAIKDKKAVAAERAGVAATRHIAEPSAADGFKGLSVRQIADKLVGRKRFTY